MSSDHPQNPSADPKAAKAAHTPERGPGEMEAFNIISSTMG
jgi:hypothetical protein